MSDVVDDCLARMRARGFDKAQVRRTLGERTELQAEFGKPSLMRSVHNAALTLTGIVDDRRASTMINKESPDEIDRAVDALWQSAQASMADPANDIAGAQPPQSFGDGAPAPDPDAMYDRLAEFVDYSAGTYPSVIIGMAGIVHVRSSQIHANSNGVRFESERGHYQASAMFSAKEGTDVSSFNGVNASLTDLSTPIARVANVDTLLHNATEQVRTRKIADKFTGDLVITPNCTGAFLGFLVENIGGGPMVAGTSVYKGRLGEAVAAPSLTLRATPRVRPGGYDITSDCYPAEDTTVVERGCLRSYLLDLYAARKTGLDRSPNTGGCFSVDAGDTPLDEMIAGVERGILIGRFSGGRPSATGDFAGVAKNSYYIEGGEVRYPISETMVSGNFADALLSISAISSERADFGSQAFPWIRTVGIGVS